MKMKKKILMVKNIKHDDWTMPGGAVEKGEILSEAVVREAKEETGLTIEAGDILSVNEAFMEKYNHHAIFFLRLWQRSSVEKFRYRIQKRLRIQHG